MRRNVNGKQDIFHIYECPAFCLCSEMSFNANGVDLCKMNCFNTNYKKMIIRKR